jgi:hypothetical protein
MRGTYLALLLLVPLVVCAGDESLFLQDLRLADGRTVVVAEAQLEPRSIGSYSIRLYGSANPEYRFDDFVSGIVVARDGTVERIALEDINGDGTAELVVVLRSVGTGSYQSARAFTIGAEDITALASVDNLEPGLDPIEQLRH